MLALVEIFTRQVWQFQDALMAAQWLAQTGRSLSQDDWIVLTETTDAGIFQTARLLGVERPRCASGQG